MAPGANKRRRNDVLPHKKASGCTNDLCQSKESNRQGPDGALCQACNARWRRWLKTDQRGGPDGWKTTAAGRSRKGIHKKVQPTAQLDSEQRSSDSEGVMAPKRAPRGGTLRAHCPDGEKCQACFDYSMNYRKAPGEPKCVGCTKTKRICRKLQLQADGSLPAKRAFSSVPPKPGTLRFEQFCDLCAKASKRCDAQQPINPMQPCTPCRTGRKRYCISQAQRARADAGPRCLACARHSRRCDRLAPCDVYKETGHSRCTYESDDKTRWYTVLVSPVSPDQGTNDKDANVDHYNGSKQWCRFCEIKGGTNRCDFRPGGPPCTPCFDSVQRGADRCTNWTGPGEIESVATRMFHRNDSNEIVRDITKDDNWSRSNIAPGAATSGRRRPAVEDSDDIDEYQEQEEDDIYSEEYRAKAREALKNHNFRTTFMTATTLAAFENSVDVALRPDPQSFAQAMKSPDAHQ